ncbi:hypothetical protein RIR_jg40013.t1 [Rhizophagus irregularis DAOM 181602=DAOM 197198]|nr:hypothetical protein RIR_jg40013.t1 [Rhizophagus irregularis DAOM 181602=DAOM 197198]
MFNPILNSIGLRKLLDSKILRTLLGDLLRFFKQDEKHLVAPSLQLHGRDFVSPAELSLSVDDPAVLSLGGLFSVKLVIKNFVMFITIEI